jgi:hypothetical protein
MSGIVIPIEIQHENGVPFSLYFIYSQVYQNLVELDQKYEELTKYHLKLFSLNDNAHDEHDPIESLYRDIMSSSVVGCYINDTFVYIDPHHDREYYLINHNGDLLDTNVYTWINFIVITNKGSITISCYESCGNFFSDNSIFDINIDDNDNTIILIDENYLCHSLSEYFDDFFHNFQYQNVEIENYENIIFLAKTEYENYRKGFVQLYEDDVKWNNCMTRDNYIVEQDWRCNIPNIPNCTWEEYENQQDNPQEVD